MADGGRERSRQSCSSTSHGVPAHQAGGCRRVDLKGVGVGFFSFILQSHAWRRVNQEREVALRKQQGRVRFIWSPPLCGCENNLRALCSPVRCTGFYALHCNGHFPCSCLLYCTVHCTGFFVLYCYTC
jgi:hypothetical protein